VGIGISYVVTELSSDQTSADAIVVPNVPNTIHHYSPVKTVRVALDKGEGIVKRFSCGGKHRSLASTIEDENHWNSR
jgi:hypothetical protein